MSTINEENIQLVPVDVFTGLRNKDTVQCVADVSDSLNNTYFEFESSDIDGTVSQFYAWFNTGAGSDPGGTGTGIEVSISTNDSAVAVATALDAALTADAGRFSNSRTTDTVTIESGMMGAVTAANDAGSTGFTFTSVTVGERFEFGATDDVSVTVEFGSVDVTASQLGETLLDSIQNSSNLTITVPAKEAVAALFKETLGSVDGDILTVGSDEIIGVGESKRFQNLKQYSKELVLRPSNESDLANAWAVWRARPNLTGLNFSGSELQVLELEFTAFRDSSRPEKVSVAGRGKVDKGMLK